MFDRLFGKRRAPALSKEALLASRPVLNTLVDWSVSEEGEIHVNIPRKEAWWVNWLSVLVRPPDKKTIALDDIGSMVWKMIDDGTTVRAMIEKLAKRYKLNRREAEASLMEYLRILAKRNLIGFEVPRAA